MKNMKDDEIFNMDSKEKFKPIFKVASFNTKNKPKIPEALRKSLEDRGVVLNSTLSENLNDSSELDSAQHVSDFEINSILIEAERILNIMDETIYTLARLTRRQKNILSLYFYVFNPFYRRIVNVFTKLPLSYLTIQKPKDVNTITQDYIFNFYTNMLQNCNWAETVRKAFLNYQLFGTAYVMIEDEFTAESEVQYNNLDISEFKAIDLSKIPEVSENAISKEKVVELINTYVNNYNVDKSKVTEDQVRLVVNATITNYNPNYKGMIRLRVIDPFEILNVEVNPEVGFKAVTLPKSEYIQKFISNNTNSSDDEIVKALMNMGYSKTFIEMNLDKSSEEAGVVIDNLPLSSDVYLAEFSHLDIGRLEISPMDAILSDTIDYYRAREKRKEKIKNMNKKGFLITPSSDHEISVEQMEELSSHIISSASEGMGFIAVANFNVSANELDLTTSDKIDVDTIIDASVNNMAVGVGVPQGMISGEDSYGSNYLKMEVLNEEFYNIRSDLSSFIEKQIFKPIAIKKGFVTTDAFGNAIPVYPKINFKVGTIVNTSEFRDILRDVADSEQIPYGMFLDYLGIDPEDAYQGVAKERKRKSETDRIIASSEENLDSETLGEDLDIGGGDDISGGDTPEGLGSDTGGDSLVEDTTEASPKPQNKTETII